MFYCKAEILRTKTKASYLNPPPHFRLTLLEFSSNFGQVTWCSHVFVSFALHSYSCGFMIREELLCHYVIH